MMREHASIKPSIPETLPFYFKPKDAEALGVPRDRLRTWLRRGWIEHVSYGLYRIASAPISEHETVARICARVPDGVVCLLSALRVHNIGTQSPASVWLAIQYKTMEPVLHDFSVRLVRFTSGMMTYAVDVLDVQGVSIRITSPARTVVDCFRFRNKIGLDIAIEAMKDALASRMTTPSQLVATAKRCRAFTVIRPYLETVTS